MGELDIVTCWYVSGEKGIIIFGAGKRINELPYGEYQSFTCREGLH
jgi:hypothetical protein